MKYQTALIAAAIALIATPAAFADRDDHDHGHGHGWEHDRHGPPDWAPAHGYRHHHDEDDDERVIVVPQERVIVEQPAVVVPPPQPVMVYPPWFVQQQGQYVYQQQYQPVAPAVAVNRCNSQAVGSVLGGIVGGVLGHQIGGGNGKTLATIGGAVTGVLVGGEIGRSMDQGCVGQVLEVAPVGQRVQWVESGTTYVVVPQRVVMRHGHHCRPYTVQMRTHHGWETTQGMACRRPDGVWVRA